MSHRTSPDRSFHMTWQDPNTMTSQALALGGLAYLQAIVRGELPAPPICDLVGMEFVEAAPGRIVMVLKPSERHYNALGTVHGGVAATVLDSVMGNAVHCTLPPGRSYTTLEIKINYLRAVTAGRLTCGGRLVQREGDLAVLESEVFAGDLLVCKGLGTYMVFPPKGGARPPGEA